MTFLFSAGCDNPKVQASSYTSSDAQVLTHIPFIAEFTLTCSNGVSDIPLYASINGALGKLFD
jgi:translocon-associated protein subunit delta